MKTLILHDVPQRDAQAFLPGDAAGYTFLSATPVVRACVGCFGCWVQTPGRCVIADRGAGFLALLPAQDMVVFLSRGVFGGFSPDMKAVLDRSIGFVLPFFCRRNGETHHAKRYEKTPNFRYIFYGDMSEREKETAGKLAAANAVNLGAGSVSVLFCRTAQEGMEALR